MNTKYAFGIDIGGTKIEFAQVDANGTILKKKRVLTNVSGGFEGVVQQIIATLNEMQNQSMEKAVGLGIGIPGQVDKVTEIIDFAPNLKWHNVNLKEVLQKAMNLPVAITNDVRAITMGEWHFGAGKGCSNLVCLIVGTGIGGGIVCNGKLLHGSTNTAGELGHIIIDWRGLPCTCGNNGCLEAYAGGWAIAKRAQIAVRNKQDAGRAILNLANDKIDDISPVEVFKAYYAGDILAKKLVDETIDALVAGCISIINSLNPERLILGGGIIQAMPEMIEHIDKCVRIKALPSACKRLQIQPAQLGPEAGVIGAARWSFNLDCA